MAKGSSVVDVLVLGGHPSAYLAAALLKDKTKFAVMHSCIPNEPTGDRLVLMNPALFELHPLLSSMKRKIEATGLYGIRFLADEPPTASEFRSKSAVTCVAQLKDVQMAMEQPGDTVATRPPIELLRHWAKVLVAHGVFKSPLEIEESEAEGLDLPFGGALAHEGVGNRTLLIGPIGGFYSATGEDVYPCCWSAIHAADVLKKAMKEQFLQDAIQAYRQKWRTTLGDYLRGPQQNLRF